jgi:hypothetical protein
MDFLFDPGKAQIYSVHPSQNCFGSLTEKISRVLSYPPAGLRPADPDVGGLDDVIDEVESEQLRIQGEALLQIRPRNGLR